MIIELITFAFIKTMAALGLLIFFGVPLFLVWIFTFGPTDVKEGLDVFKTHRWARWLYWSTVGVVLTMAYIVYAAWIWPFNVPREVSFDRHFSGGLWHVVTENLEQYRQRVEKDKPPVRTELGTEIRRYELVSWNPPKHFYVTLKDVETGQRYEGQYVSKHCNDRDLKHGEQYNLKVRYFGLSNKPGERFVEFTNLYSAFCRD